MLENREKTVLEFLFVSACSVNSIAFFIAFRKETRFFNWPAINSANIGVSVRICNSCNSNVYFSKNKNSDT